LKPRKVGDVGIDGDHVGDNIEVTLDMGFFIHYGKFVGQTAAALTASYYEQFQLLPPNPNSL
jgi:hypothetical protein